MLRNVIAGSYVKAIFSLKKLPNHFPEICAIYIFTSNNEWSSFSVALLAFGVNLFFFSNSDSYIIVFHCCFNFQFPNSYSCDYLLSVYPFRLNVCSCLLPIFYLGVLLTFKWYVYILGTRPFKILVYKFCNKIALLDIDLQIFSPSV